MSNLLCVALQLFVLLIFARILLSWFPAAPGSGLATVVGYVGKATDWLLVPMRKVIPPVRIGSGLLDLTPMIVLLVIQIILLPAIGCGAGGIL